MCVNINVFAHASVNIGHMFALTLGKRVSILHLEPVLIIKRGDAMSSNEQIKKFYEQHLGRCCHGRHAFEGAVSVLCSG